MVVPYQGTVKLNKLCEVTLGQILLVVNYENTMRFDLPTIQSVFYLSVNLS